MKMLPAHIEDVRRLAKEAGIAANAEGERERTQAAYGISLLDRLDGAKHGWTCARIGAALRTCASLLDRTPQQPAAWQNHVRAALRELSAGLDAALNAAITPHADEQPAYNPGAER